MNKNEFQSSLAATDLVETDLMTAVDMLTIDTQTIQQAGQARMKSVDYHNQALKQRAHANSINELWAGLVKMATTGSAFPLTTGEPESQPESVKQEVSIDFTVIAAWDAALEDVSNKTHKVLTTAAQKRIKTFIARFWHGKKTTELYSEDSNYSKNIQIACEKDIPAMIKEYSSLIDIRSLYKEQ